MDNTIIFNVQISNSMAIGLDSTFDNSLNYLKLIKKITEKEQMTYLKKKNCIEIENKKKFCKPKDDTKDVLLVYNRVEIQNFRDYALEANELVNSKLL